MTAWRFYADQRQGQQRLGGLHSPLTEKRRGSTGYLRTKFSGLDDGSIIED
jgi:hypothetical protein